MKHSVRFAPTLVLAVLSAGSNAAETVRVDPYDSGTLRNRTPSIVLVGSILASMDDNVDDGRYRNYFKYDLSGLSGTVLSAYLELEFPAGAYDSKEDAELYELFEVTADPDTFGFDFASCSYHAFSSDVWRDLGDGTPYGKRRYTESDEGATTRVNLNDEAIDDINAVISRDGFFVIGGKLSPKLHPDFGTSTAVDSDWVFLETGAAETDLCYGAWFWTTRALVLDFGP